MQTRAPDPQILRQMLNLYLKIDKGEGDETKSNNNKQSHTLIDKAFKAAINLKDYAIATFDNASPELAIICNDVLEKIKDDNTPKHWIELVVLLGNKAAEAQSKKSRLNLGYQSRCCEILHMMRSYIMMIMTSVDDEYKLAYDNAIIASTKDFFAQLNEIFNELPRRNGIDIADLTTKLNSTLTDLSYLCYRPQQLKQIWLAQWGGQFSYLFDIPQKNHQLHIEFKKDASRAKDIMNNAIRYCMQNNRDGVYSYWFCEIGFNDRYASKLGIDFQKWYAQAVKKSLQKRAESQTANRADFVEIANEQARVLEVDNTKPSAADDIFGTMLINTLMGNQKPAASAPVVPAPAPANPVVVKPVIPPKPAKPVSAATPVQKDASAQGSDDPDDKASSAASAAVAVPNGSDAAGTPDDSDDDDAQSAVNTVIAQEPDNAPSSPRPGQ